MAPLAVANHDTTHDEVHEHVPGNVAIPRTPELLLPMLRAAHDLGGSATRAELLDHVRGVAELTDEQIAVVYAGASGKSKVLHRAEWAIYWLNRIGALESSQWGVWAITSLGTAFLQMEEAEAGTALAARRTTTPASSWQRRRIRQKRRPRRQRRGRRG